jgi:Mrp family chromosome partitioning ATPase
MIDSVLREQFEVLRARLECSVTLPAVVSVTSAVAGDGKSCLAFGLADAFAEAKYRVLLVDANSFHPEISAVPQETVVHFDRNLTPRTVRVSDRFDAMSLATPRVAAEFRRDSVASVVRWALDQYDLTIVDTAPAPRSNLALLFAAQSATTILALRHGRRVSDTDRATLAALERAEAPVFGVVVTNRDARDAFGKARETRRVETINRIVRDVPAAAAGPRRAKTSIVSSIVN